MKRPIELVVEDDVRRSRVTAFLRLVLAAPHVVLLALWSVAALGAAVLNWVATSAAGRSPAALHKFLAGFVRYATRVTAYVYLVGGPFPDFTLARPYAVDAEVAPPARQRRWRALLRPLLALPAFVLASVLHVVMACVAFAAWFAAIATARMPAGMRELSAYCLRYQAETVGYLVLLTERSPSLASPVTAR